MKAILFDLDDTLFDHTHSAERALRDARERHAALRPVPFVELQRLSSHILEDLHPRVLSGELPVQQARILRFQRLFGEVGRAISEEEALAIAHDYRRVYEETWRPVDGACALVARLKPLVSIGIVTNNLAAEQTSKLRVCGLMPAIDALIVSEEAGVTKPDPAIFALALQRLQCAADDTVMVGDSWAMDVMGARAAGLRAVWFNRTGRACPDPTLARELISLEPAEEVARLLLA